MIPQEHSITRLRYTRSVNSAMVFQGIVTDEERIYLIGHQTQGQVRQHGLLTILAAHTGQILHEVPLGIELRDLCLHPHRPELALLDAQTYQLPQEKETPERPGQIFQIDSRTGHVLQTLTIGLAPHHLWYCSAQDSYYLTYVSQETGNRVVATIDASWQRVQEILQLPWGPTGFLFAEETGDVLILGARDVLALDHAGHSQSLHHVAHPSRGIQYRGHIKEKLYFSQDQAIFSLTLPDYQYHLVQETEEFALTLIDEQRAIAYFMPTQKSEPSQTRLYAKALDVPNAPMQVLGMLPLPVGNQRLLHYDATHQRCYFHTWAPIENAVQSSLIIIDLPLWSGAHDQGITILPLDYRITDIAFLEDHRYMVVPTGDYLRTRVIVYEMID